MLETGDKNAEVAMGSRGTKLWIALVVISVFGPYVVATARTEQIAVIASALAVLIFGWPRIMRARAWPAMSIFGLWFGLYVVIVIATYSPAANLDAYGQQPPLHALVSFALPLALMLIGWFWTLLMPLRDIVTLIARIVVIGMLLNAAIGVWQLVTNKVQVFSLLPHFWTSTSSGNAVFPVPVAVLASGNGRFTGIFNQPAEAGIAYSISLFCLIFLIQARSRTWSMGVAFCGVALCVGGLLTISKIFLIGGLPIGVLLIVRDHQRRVRAILSISVILFSIWLLRIGGILPSWRIGSVMINRLINPGSSSFVATVSANRYGSGGSLGPIAVDILHSSPWMGFGAGGIATSYDSMWLETLAVAGMFGVTLITLVFVVLFTRWVRLHRALPESEWRLAGATVVLAIGGSLGLPALTGNRVSTLLWLIIGILIASRDYTGQENFQILTPGYPIYLS